MIKVAHRASDVIHPTCLLSNSVYGNRRHAVNGLRGSNQVDSPVSLYVATKRVCKLMSESYPGLYGFPQIGFCFFIVGGPRVPPNMARSTSPARSWPVSPSECSPKTRRLGMSTLSSVLSAASGDCILKVGDNLPVGLMNKIETLEQAPVRKAVKAMRQCNGNTTYAKVNYLYALTGYDPKVILVEMLDRLTSWYKMMRPNEFLTRKKTKRSIHLVCLFRHRSRFKSVRDIKAGNPIKMHNWFEKFHCTVEISKTI